MTAADVVIDERLAAHAADLSLITHHTSSVQARARARFGAAASSEPPTATFFEGGSLLVVREPGGSSRHEPTARGRIRGFSNSARRRLLEKIAKVDLDAAGPSVFVTLTYPREWDHDPDKWKRDLDRFGVVLRRRFPNAFGVWRLEPQGRGAPHSISSSGESIWRRVIRRSGTCRVGVLRPGIASWGVATSGIRAGVRSLSPSRQPQAPVQLRVEVCREDARGRSRRWMGISWPVVGLVESERHADMLRFRRSR
jgi:hypothetical protein